MPRSAGHKKQRVDIHRPKKTVPLFPQLCCLPSVPSVALCENSPCLSPRLPVSQLSYFPFSESFPGSATAFVPFGIRSISAFVNCFVGTV